MPNHTQPDWTLIMRTIPTLAHTPPRRSTLGTVMLVDVRAGQAFMDEAGMWHTAWSDVRATQFRGTSVLVVETTTGRVLYADLDTIVPIR